MDELALRTLLNSLEASRPWLHLLLHIFTWSVVIGLGFDLVAIIKEFLDDWGEFRYGQTHSDENYLPKRPNISLLILALLGTTLIVVGVAGELYVDVQAGYIDTKMREANDKLLGLIIKEAGYAAKSAKDAHDLGTDLIGKYQTAEDEITELKAEKLPRRLSSDQKAIFQRAVGSFTGKTLNIWCVSFGGGSKEMLDFELDFVDAIKGKTPINLRYLVSCSTEISGVGFAPPIEVDIGADRTHDGDVLTKTLGKLGIKKKEIVIRPNNDKASLDLTIGQKAP